MNLLFLGRVFTLIALFSLSVNVFAASPRINYLLYCTGCHAANGAGKPPNVPSLRDELGRMISVPEMRSYLVRIPGASQAPISDADLTDVINWLLREFNSNTLPANFEEYTVGEVSNARRNILADPLRYRAEHWKSYDD
ncbi:MAG: cytochrome c [Gammaproteobacteria bacterium]|jgi:hypothetical protein|nr:cytochrome c [Gammaproteobacteria bacterium]